MTDEEIELAESVVEVRLQAVKLSEAMNLHRYETARGLADEIAQRLEVIRNALARA